MFDMSVTLKTIRIMKEALAAEGLDPFLMTQANGFHCSDAPRTGYIGCPEYPYGEYRRGRAERCPAVPMSEMPRII